jgi:large subunit ribosomal protein L13
MILRGKYKPSYTPHVDCGDNVIVNSRKINLVTKMDERLTSVTTGYPGGQRTLTAKSIASKKSCIISENSKGMLLKKLWF